MVKICGIDEAGRGPVIGPLVVAGILIDSDNVDKLKEIGVKDSKLLSKKKREELFDKVIELVDDYHIIEVEPAEIDEALESDTLNLNWLEAIKSAMIINKLQPDKAIVDCPSNNKGAYTEYLMNFVKNKDIEMVVEHGADKNYVEAGAASILAKVVRDNLIDEIKSKLNIDFGSGYPSDPKTKEFLQKQCKVYPDICRKTWASYKNSINVQKKLV